MANQNAQFMDRLRRALNMEESLANQIVEIVNPDALPAALSPADKEKIRAGLITVRDDTRRHVREVGALIARLSKGAS
jgi:hypothetical protein